MRRLAIAAFAATVLLSIAVSADARSRRRTSGAGASRAGEFDYYVMSLSWSPQYCSGPGGARDGGQCGEGRRFGFVVHGLWPQYEHGYPQACGEAAPVPASIVNAMLPLMPSPRLIEHEWAAHGTCSGLAVQAYFEEIRRAHAAVQVPADFQQPQREVMVAPAEVKSRFARANPSFPAEAFRVQCGGRYLSEVRVCLSRELRGRACSTDVRDTCRDASVIMRPVR